MKKVKARVCHLISAEDEMRILMQPPQCSPRQDPPKRTPMNSSPVSRMVLPDSPRAQVFVLFLLAVFLFMDLF
jgi:hypothetical protein